MSTPDHRSSALSIALILAGSGLMGFAGAWAFQASGLGTGASQALVRDYILQNPEVLPQAMENLQARDTSARIAPLRAVIEKPWPGAVLGNPDGKVTLVEFSDYACTYCRASLAEVQAVIAANPDLKVVIREFPILTDGSVKAAGMALAAADQGRFAAFHVAMFEEGNPDDASIAAAARRAGVDLARAQRDIASGKYDAELANNARAAQGLGISGTPAFIAGDSLLPGALGRDALTKAISKARGPQQTL